MYRKITQKGALLLIIVLLRLATQAQNIEYARSLIATLASPEFHGRGYVLKGDSIAANFIATELNNHAILNFGKGYYQEFTMDANTFPGSMDCTIHNRVLKPGQDYIVSPASSSINGTYKVVTLDSKVLNHPKKYKRFLEKDLTNRVLYIDTLGNKNELFKKQYADIINRNTYKTKAIIEPKNSLVFAASQGVLNHAIIQIVRTSIPKKLRNAEIHIENKFLKSYTSRNVLGYIQGSVDTFIVFTAHYDHLGRMGAATYFPGAHDNASGVAMLLDLASYFAKPENKPHYSIAFIFFSGEESGLLGSRHYAFHPVFPLTQIKFLMNLDIIGSGEDGVQVVNATEYTQAFSLLQQINAENSYLKQIKSRGPAANSDHYFFHAQEVPSFFIYTLGAYKEYHNIYDRAEAIPLSGYNGLFKLMIDFVTHY